MRVAGILKFLTAFVLVCMFSACDNGAKEKIMMLEAQRDSLVQANQSVQDRFEEVSGYLDVITEAVDSVAINEGLLLVNKDPETGRKFNRKEMRERVAKLGEIIDRQRTRIAELSDSLQAKDKNAAEVARLTSLVAYLNKQLAEKEVQMQQLQAELESSKRSIIELTATVQTTQQANEKLTADVSALDQQVVESTNRLNQGYLLAKNKNDLKNMGILSGGGFLKKAKFDSGSVNLSQCTPVDIRSFSEVTLTSKKKPNVLSQIPSTSYTLQEAGSGKWQLIVVDTASFWSLSKVVIIELR